MHLLHQLAHPRPGEDHVRLDQIDDLEEFEFIAVIDIVGPVPAARDDLLEVLLVAELRGHGDDLDPHVVLDCLGPMPQPRSAGPDGHPLTLQTLLVPIEPGLPLGPFLGDQFLAPLLDAEKGADLADAIGHIAEAPGVDVQPGDAVALLQLVRDIAGGTGAVDHAELRLMHGPQIIVAAVAREMRDNLNAKPIPVLLQQEGIALDVEVADQVHGVFAGDLLLQRAHLLIDPADIQYMVALGLGDSGKPRALHREDIDVRALTHDLLDRRFDVIADQSGRTSGIDDHPLDVRHLVEGFIDGLGQTLVTAEDDMLFLHVGRPDVLHVEVAVIGRVALGMPGIVGATDRAMDHLDGVFEYAANDQFGAAKGAAAFRQGTWDRRCISDRQAGCGIVVG